MYKIDLMLEIKESDIYYFGLLWLKGMNEDDEEGQINNEEKCLNRRRDDKNKCNRSKFEEFEWKMIKMWFYDINLFCDCFKVFSLLNIKIEL